MGISPPQCRAARALIDWTQDQLAQNAQVARATIADFERNVRTPMRNNLVAICSAFEAAGIELVAENGGGAGVRFRDVQLEYSRHVRADLDGVTIEARYRGKGYHIRIPLAVIDDMDRTHYRGPDELREAVARRLPIHLCAAERAIVHGRIGEHNYVLLTHEKFEEGTF